MEKHSNLRICVIPLLFLLGALALATAADVPKDLFNSPHSKQLNRREFLESISGSQVHVVEFYSEDCRGCQKFAREWKEIAEKFKDRNGLVISQVNCTAEGRLCRQHAVNSFPAIKVYQNGEVFITYEGILFGELVEKFIASVANDLLEETTH